MEEEFINAIRGKEEISRTSFYDGYRYMEFSQAVSESLRTKKSIAMPLGNL